MGRALFPLLVATAVAGCASKTPEPTKTPLDQVPAPAATTGDELTGPVQERLNAPPYIYLRIKTSKGDVWAAVPEAKIENGAVVTVLNPMRMTKFESTTLSRTFDEVYFGTLTPPAIATAGHGDNPHAGIQAPVPVDVGKVEKAAGPNARTVAEVWARRTALAGKTVSIRGVVVKYNGGVLGKNWIHLQDGTGNATERTNDIPVTSLDEVALGETVTITGTLHTNKDFGAGYTYAIIVEDAKVAKEQRSASRAADGPLRMAAGGR